MREETKARNDILKKQQTTRHTLLEAILGDHERHLSAFIFTKASPSVCYIPKVHNDKTTALLRESAEACLERTKNGFVLEKQEEQDALAEKAKQDLDALL